MTNQTQHQELSEEELIEKRAEITAFYKENITHLKVQLEYETMLRDIEKARAERIQAQMFLAQSMAQPPVTSNDTKEVDNEIPVQRTLKKVNNEI